MALAGRSLAALAGTLALIACASLAGLEAPDAPPDAGIDAPYPSAIDASQTPSPPDADPPDVASEGAPDVDTPCTAANEGDSCASNAACCSGQCGFTRKCVKSCFALEANCVSNVFGCCVGTYCSTQPNIRCARCRPKGAQAETDGRNIREDSCCSGEVEGTTCK